MKYYRATYAQFSSQRQSFTQQLEKKKKKLLFNNKSKVILNIKSFSKEINY